MVDFILILITMFTVAVAILVTYENWSTRKKKSKTKHS